jgi:hypothetical protein
MATVAKRTTIAEAASFASASVRMTYPCGAIETLDLDELFRG